MALTRRIRLGDWASDAFLASSQGQAALAAAQAAAARLPAGFTMGDPTGDLWGASYYNGHKVVEVGQSGPGGQLYYGLDDGTLGPVVSDATNQAIENAADAAYAVNNYIYGLRGSTNPAMVAVLSDPEWINLQGKQVVWENLSAELQAKIKLVPNLYNQLTGGNEPAPPPPPPSTPTGPAMYLVAGILFDANGAVYNQSTHQPTGETLTADEVHSLLTTGQLPAGSPPMAPQANSPASSTPTAQPVAPSPSSPIPSTAATSSPTGTSLATPGGSGGSAAIPAPSGSATDVGGNMSAANPSMSIAAPSPAGGGQGTAVAPGDGGGLPPWLLYVALAVVGLVAIRGSKR